MNTHLPIYLARELAKRICEEAMQAYPHECCGALLGRDHASNSPSRQIVDVLPLGNRENEASRNRFAVSPEDVVEAEQRARAQSLDVVGWYHSHPDYPARPSETDRENALPWYSYVIVSVVNGQMEDLRSWRLNDDRTGYSEETVTSQYVPAHEDRLR